MASVDRTWSASDAAPVTDFTGIVGDMQIFENSSFSPAKFIMQGSTSAAHEAVRYSGATSFDGDHIAKGTVWVLDGASFNYVGPAVRCQSGAETYYYIEAYTGGHKIVKVDAGSRSTIATGGAAVSAGDVVELEANGSTIQARINSADTISVTDTDITGGTPGWASGWGGGRGTDHWIGEDVVAGSQPVPELAASSITIGLGPVRYGPGVN